MKVKIITDSTCIKDEQICEFSNHRIKSLRDKFDNIIRIASPVIQYAHWIENEDDIIFGYVVVMKDSYCLTVAKKLEG